MPVQTLRKMHRHFMVWMVVIASFSFLFNGFLYRNARIQNETLIEQVDDLRSTHTAQLQQAVVSCQRGNALRFTVSVLLRGEEAEGVATPDFPFKRDILEIVNCRRSALATTGTDPGAVTNFPVG